MRSLPEGDKYGSERSEKMFYNYSFRFSKSGDMIYISHLDLLRLLGRAGRRADLPIALTQGYNPRLKIRLKKALKLGIASDSEEGELVLKEMVDAADIKSRLQEQLPPGIEVKDVVSSFKGDGE